MKIVDDRKTKQVYFGDLHPGEAFEFNGGTYIKAVRGEKYYGVDLEDGFLLINLAGDDSVIRLTAEVVIK